MTYTVEGEQVSARTAARRINDWEGYGQRYVYADLQNGERVRISRAKSSNGQLIGRIVMGSPRTWVTFPEETIFQLC